MTYGKIDTLFDRDDKFRVDTTRVRRPAFAAIDHWLVTEKVDGTNMRIEFVRPRGGATVAQILGKTDNASIPPMLLAHCTALAQRIIPTVTETMADHDLTTYTLYGEGYGAKIQKGGGRYRDDQGFILFDIGVASGRFLSDQVVTDTAAKLDIPRVPLLQGGDPMSTDEIVRLVRGGFASDAADVFDPDFAAEGVVARPAEPLYDNRGARIIWKLKQRDFTGGKR